MQHQSLIKSVRERFEQLYIVLLKDFKLALRRKLSFVQILAPIFFLVVLLILQVVPHPAYYENGQPPATSVGGLPPCIAFDQDYCFSLMYAPANLTSIDPIIQRIANDSKLPVVPFNEDLSQMPSQAIVGMESQEQIINFLNGNQNVTQAAVVFYPDYSFKNADPDTDLNTFFSYNVLFNGTCLTPFVPLGTKCPNIRYILQRTIDEAFIALQTNEETTITFARRPYPTVTFKSALNDTVSTYGILFFYCGMMFCFVIIIYQMVYEKEKHLKQGMKLMGLKSSVYWTSWFIFGTVMTLLETLGLMATGYACTFAFFWKTNFFVNFLIFFLFGEAMLMLAFWITTFLNTSKAAITAGMLLFIVGSLLQMLLSSPSLLSFVYFDHYWVSTLIYYILIWYPPLNFAKAIEDVTSKSFDYGDYVGTGYSWSDLYDYYTTSNGVTLPPTVQSIYLLMINMIVFAILTWYFENILPGERGSMGNLFFFLTKEYWGIPRVIEAQIPEGNLQRAYEDPSTIDVDVLKEDEVARVEGSHSAVRVIRLSKNYKQFPYFHTRGTLAQDSISFCIPEGTLFCLLGHNGAGKTTTINILTGLFPPTSGDAFIYGKSILTEMNEIRQSMGVCPQHDILWEELTAREHLELYARLKCVPGSERKSLIDEKLEMVRLTKVGNNRVGSYSGGMKRRLSVAISSIGEPNIIFLDEPTTGMDPMSRRHVWELIEKMKKNRVVILTTHSMEEADILSDRIGIMAHGKLRCIGNSLHLKNRFGDGYRVNIACEIHNIPQVKEKVTEYVSTATLIAESGSSLVFGIDTTNYDLLVPFFRFLEEEERKPNSLIRDWGISQTSLEDVFLKVTRQVYSGGNRIDGH